MRRIYAPALLCLAMLAPAWGQDPPPAPAPVGPIAIIGGPLRPVPDGSAVVVNASGSVSAYDLSWSVTPETPLLAVDRPPQRFAFLVQPPSGTYIVTATALGLTPDGKTPLGNSASVLVVVGTPPAPRPDPAPSPPDPQPSPAPDPGPVNPLPAVVDGPLVATLVYDPAAMTPQLAALKDSVAIPAQAKALDARYMTLSTTASISGQPAGSEYARRGLGPIVAALGGAPALVFQRPDGTVVHKAKAPGDEAGVVAALKQLRGK